MNSDNQHFTRYLEALKASIFFKHASVDELRPLLKAMVKNLWTTKTFRNSREVKSTFHFIVSGRIKEFQMHPKTGREHTIFLLSGGDVFDVLYLLDNELHDVYWESIEEVEILAIATEDMRNWIFKTPHAHHSVLSYLAQSMRILKDAVADIALHGTLVRLANLLLKNINGHSHKLELINNLSNEEIACLIGTTRAVVNRHIQELKHCGAISVKRKQIDIENIQILMSISEEKYHV